jgi:hypothetical protein
LSFLGDTRCVRQYVYFALFSELMPAEEMTRRLGLAPDEVDVRASRQVYPPRPAVHSWKMVCSAPGLTVDEQVSIVIGRLRPLVDEIGRLARHLDATEGGARLQVVRYLSEGDPNPILLGWRLDREVVDFLHTTRAVLDIDEYP